jgi:hypothetical protein
VRIHTHLTDELPAQAWLSKDELLLHLSEYHGMLIGPVGKTIESLARIHIEEHKKPGGR